MSGEIFQAVENSSGAFFGERSLDLLFIINRFVLCALYFDLQ